MKQIIKWSDYEDVMQKTLKQRDYDQPGSWGHSFTCMGFIK